MMYAIMESVKIWNEFIVRAQFIFFLNLRWKGIQTSRNAIDRDTVPKYDVGIFLSGRMTCFSICVALNLGIFYDVV